MLIKENSNPRQWAWTPGKNNPADLITRIGCKAATLDTPFWKNSGFLNEGPEEGWPITSCLKINTEIKHLEIKAVSVKVDLRQGVDCQDWLQGENSESIFCLVLAVQLSPGKAKC